MAFEYLAYTLSLQAESRNLRNRRRLLREVDSPFELPHAEFQNLYRLNPEAAEDLISELGNKLKGSRITALSTEKQVLATLRFYATGCYQRPIGEHWGISMSQASISRCIHRVTDAINEILFFKYVKFPMTQVEREAAKTIFASSSAAFVGGTIGAIDCTHVAILTPKNHDETYKNDHGYHSINVQMICDPNLKILNVNAKYPGAAPDSYIWNCSAVRRVMQRSYENGNHMYLVGDSGYPLEPWLMTPLNPNQPEGTPEFRYNESLLKARKPIERLFRVLKANWRCLSQKSTLLYEPGFSGKIVNACAVLHNIKLREQSFECDEEEGLEEQTFSYVALEEPSLSAIRVQDKIIASHFN